MNSCFTAMRESTSHYEKKTLLVTCGATIPFPRLLALILSQEALRDLRASEFERLIIQFGNGYREEFTEQLRGKYSHGAGCSLSANDLGSETAPVSGTTLDGKLEIIGIDFSSKIQDVIKNYADLVISHAGTGSILDSIRLCKPLVVCVNDELMDNHQQQIAEKFESDGYVWTCKPTVHSLRRCLAKFQRESLRTFETAVSVEFERQLLSLVYPNTSTYRQCLR